MYITGRPLAPAEALLHVFELEGDTHRIEGKKKKERERSEGRLAGNGEMRSRVYNSDKLLPGVTSRTLCGRGEAGRGGDLSAWRQQKPRQ